MSDIERPRTKLQRLSEALIPTAKILQAFSGALNFYIPVPPHEENTKIEMVHQSGLSWVSNKDQERIHDLNAETFKKAGVIYLWEKKKHRRRLRYNGRPPTHPA